MHHLFYIISMNFIIMSATIAVELKLISFNTMLLPFPASISYQGKRTKEIAKKLLQSEADFIALQEVFITSKRKYLMKKLKEKYPYQVYLGKKEGRLILVPAGLLVLSKHPFNFSKALYFSSAENFSFDKLSSKGVILVELQLPQSKKLQLAVTHLQSGLSEKKESIRIHQIQEIMELFKMHQDSQTPQVILGDTNVDGHSLQEMNKIFNQFPQLYYKSALDSNTKYSSGHRIDCISPFFNFNADYKMTWLDHLWAVKNPNSSLKIHTQAIVPLLGKIRNKECILSDHHSLELNISL
jgi:endonuclease/exonuclease/phosphatase family metal-dependent hydrolase